MIAAQMTRKEAIRRLENLALETGHKRKYYVKKALVEFLDRNSHLLGYRPTHQRLLDPRRSLLPPEPVSTLIRADRRDRNLLSSRRLSEWCAVTRAARELQTLSTPGVFK